MAFMPQGAEWLIILLIILLLFGFKKLPDAARSLGKSARVFKSEVNEMKEEDRQREEAKRAGKGGVISDSSVRDRRDEGDAVIREDTPRTDNQSGPVA